MIPAGEPTTHGARCPWSRAAVSSLRLRTGARLAVLSSSPDGWVVESGVRLLPGTSLDVVIGRGAAARSLRATVSHARVSAIERDAPIRYEAGLVIEPGTNYPPGESTWILREPTTRGSEGERRASAAPGDRPAQPRGWHADW